MFVRREEIIREASKLLSIALVINAVSALFAPLYLLFIKEINVIVLVILFFSTISLLLVYMLKKSVEDYSLGSAHKLTVVAIIFGFIGGFAVVGIIIFKVRKLIEEFLSGR